MAEKITPHLFRYNGEDVLRGAGIAISDVKIGQALFDGNVYSKSNNQEILVTNNLVWGVHRVHGRPIAQY